jgi:Skp family chaperone for outer membrane proteins
MLCATQSVAQTDFPTVFPQPILVLDQDGLFNNSNLGQAMLLIQAEKRTILLQESRQISDAFEAEEKRLTEIRGEISAEEFRILSGDFDKRVQAARESQLAKDVEMQQSIDGQRLRFLVIAAPFLSEIMLKYHASAIVDQRSVLLFNRNMDITLEATDILDRAFELNPDLAIEKE